MAKMGQLTTLSFLLFSNDSLSLSLSLSLSQTKDQDMKKIKSINKMFGL
jgi:hypothetical protein